MRHFNNLAFLLIALFFGATTAVLLGDDNIRDLQTRLEKQTREQLLQGEVALREPVARGIYKVLIRHAPAEFRDTLAQVEFKFVPEDTAFSFFATPDDQNSVIRISGGALRSLDVLCWAAAVAARVLHEDAWFSHYILYVRGQLRSHGPRIEDPFIASGLTFADVPPEAIHMQSWTYISALSFILAHEAAHIAMKHDLRRSTGESQSAYFARRRSQELEADRFALEIMRNMGAAPTGAAFVSICTMMLYQQSRDVRSTADHPPDHDRLRQISEYALKHLKEYDLGDHALSEVKSEFQRGIDAAETVRTGELDFLDLNEAARNTSLKSLRRR